MSNQRVSTRIYTTPESEEAKMKHFDQDNIIDTPIDGINYHTFSEFQKSVDQRKGQMRGGVHLKLYYPNLRGSKPYWTSTGMLFKIIEFKKGIVPNIKPGYTGYIALLQRIA